MRVDPVSAAVNATSAFVTLGFTHLALVLVSAAHGFPPARTPGFARRAARVGCTGLNAAKLAYALAWAGGLYVLYDSRALLGTQLFGTPAWYAAIGARSACVLLAETRVDAFLGAPGRWLRRTFLHLERVYVTTPHTGHPDAIMGIRHMRQPLRRVAVYAALWAGMLAVKVIFDTHILTQQWRLMRTLQIAEAQGKPVRPTWDVELFGARNGVVLVGSWVTLVLLYLLDSYIVFILAAALIGAATMRRDGAGAVTSASVLRRAFDRGISLRRRRPLAAQFVRMVMPVATAAGVPAARVFRRAWDAFVMALRAGDVVSDAEQVALMYGDAVAGVEPALPLFLYAGRLPALLRRAPEVAAKASAAVVAGGAAPPSARADAAFVRAVAPDRLTRDAAAEVLVSLPAILAHVARSHSAVGHDDAHVGATIAALFAPSPGQSVAAAVAQVLSGGGGAPPARTAAATAAAVVDELVALVTDLVVEFQRDDASVAMRGSPLVAAACALLRRVAQLRGHTGLPPAPVRYAEPPSGGGGGGAVSADGATVVTGVGGDDGANGDVVASFDVADGGGDSGGSIASSTATTGGGGSGALSTRSVGGLLRLLALPCEGGGRLDGTTGTGDALSFLVAAPLVDVERLEALRECGRRAFYLLTLPPQRGTLACHEAERRVAFFIQVREEGGGFGAAPHVLVCTAITGSCRSRSHSRLSAVALHAADAAVAGRVVAARVQRADARVRR